MTIEIDKNQAAFIVATAEARIKSARQVMTPEYRRQFLGHMPDGHYDQITRERQEEIGMLQDLARRAREVLA